MSGGLAPSKSTVYVSNLPFSLTNNDLHKIFEKYGRVAKVTVLRNPTTRKSKGVAFVLFIERESAHSCCRALNNTEMFSRTIKCTIANDNGRASEFIRKKVYKDKSRCYECGDDGHLSYKCPKNLLGEREPPKKKEKRDKSEMDSEEENDDQGEGLDSLSAAIQYQQQKMSENYSMMMPSSSYSYSVEEPSRKKYKKDAYFSDEEELDDG